MSGSTARKGFEFQDLYLLLRILRAASDSLDSAWTKGTADVSNGGNDRVPKFGIEGSPRAAVVGDPSPPGPDWDVLVLSGDKLEFAEAKSGAVQKEDRLAFWRRVRRELHRNAAQAHTFVPVLVVDPSKSGDLEKWLGLATEAAGFAGQLPSNEPTVDVCSANQLLEEALWWLCCAPEAGACGPPLDLVSARELLSRFELHQHRASELAPLVDRFLELLFPGGLADTERVLLLGWLSSRATDPDPEKRLFTVQELLAEIGILQAAFSLTPGTLKDWKELWSEVGEEARGRTRTHLGRSGETIPAAMVQAAGLEALSKSESNALIVLGRGGAGKSVFLAQAVKAAEDHGDFVFYCDADNVSLEELDKLYKGLRFRAALAALRNPAARLLLAVDGLDEADAALRGRWAQLLARLRSVPNLRVLVSMREADWQADGATRTQIGSWPGVTLDLWPDQVVRNLLKHTPFLDVLPASVVDLLRTPIFLDLFWRTFVEAQSANVSLAARLQTRHDLLAAFWEERLLHSHRFAKVPDLTTRLAAAFSQAAGSVGAFSPEGLDEEIVQVLLSEGVFVPEGRLRPRLRFRHTVLRDFAFAQWCLDTDDCAESARRWNAIQGGLQQHGALRGMLDALSDPQAGSDYSLLSQGGVLHQILRTTPTAASLIAQVLGTRQTAPEIDPARWTTTPEFSLPQGFGRELLAAARLAENVTWAAMVEGWPEDALWLGEDFGSEVWKYAAWLSEKAKREATNLLLVEASRQAARALRKSSEAPRLKAQFDGNNRWLKTQAMLCVIPVLPNETTLAWVEREMAQPSTWNWSWLLDHLAPLATVDAERAATIYRRVVGLTKVDGRCNIDVSLWGGVMDHHAVEWSLAGHDGRRSLLAEHPVQFLPAALDLAEALWEHQRRDPQSARMDIIEIMKQFDPGWSDSAHGEWERVQLNRLGDLIDDQPESYWHTRPGDGAYERCLAAVHQCAEGCAKASFSDFVTLIAPILRASHLASVHSVALDILLGRKEDALSSPPLKEYVLDSRMYYVFGLRYWLEAALLHVWPLLESGEKEIVFSVIRELIGLSEPEHRAKRFLARLPADDLPFDLRQKRPPDDDPGCAPVNRPGPMGFHFEGQDVDFEPLETEEEIGEWPNEFDLTTLQTLCRASGPLQKKEASPAEIQEQLPIATAAAAKLLPALRSHPSVLIKPEHFWVWRGLAATLNGYRRSSAKTDDKGPPIDLVRDCAELALAALEEGPGKMKGDLSLGDSWVSPETPWVHALALADLALTWSPANDDKENQRRFVQVLETAFATGQPIVQLVCVTHVRVWHWIRTPERRELRDRLVWNTPQHASPLIFALLGTRAYPDDDRAQVYRSLLARADLEASKSLAHHLGRFIGECSMVVFPDGRRSQVAELAREAIHEPARFPLLQESENLRTFLWQFTFGMKEQARRAYRHIEIAVDFGDWMLRAWRLLKAFSREQAAAERAARSENLVYTAMHWIQEITVPAERAKLQEWWEHLRPLFHAVVVEGGTQDNHNLFFSLHDGKYNDLASAKELMAIVEGFVDRVTAGVGSGILQLDLTQPEQGAFQSWRDCAAYAAEVIDSLRRSGKLQAELEREQAYRLLSRLAAAPILAPKAVEALHRLQNE